MPESQRKKAGNGKPKKGPLFRLPAVDDRKKRILKKIAGLLLGAFAVFTFIALFSYLFTWKTDFSLMSDPEMIRKSVKVSNMAGKLGYGWAHFLCSVCFGLGSFAIVYLPGAYSLRLLFGKNGISYSRTLVIALSGAFVFSLVLAFFSALFGCDNAFGGGLGGDCGDVIVSAMKNLTGSIVSFIILLIFLASWLLLVSGRFSAWLLQLGERKRKPREESISAVCGQDEFSEVMSGADMVGPESGPEIEPEAEVGAAVPSEPALSVQRQPGYESPEPESERESGDGYGEPAPEGAGLEVVKGDGFSSKVTADLPRIDVREELEKFEFPPLDLLDDYASGRHEVASEELERNNNKIRATLLSYKIQVERVTACVGPTVTLYKVVPAPGVKISAIKNLEQDIAMSLNAKGVRVVRLSDSVGIEVANDRASIVPLKSMLNDEAFRHSKAELPVAIGYTITQKVKVFDLADAPHLLVAGATKQGKSVGLNVIVTSLLYAKHPSELKFVFIDPKMVEFTVYSRLLKHYLAVLPDAGDEKEQVEKSIVKNPEQAEQILRSLCIEMDARYLLFSKAVVNDVKLYNDKYRDRRLLPTEGHRYMPYIVVIIDEYADLIMTGGMGGNMKNLSKSITTSIIRLAQKGRAAGIHVIIATQRPSVDVITGLIKTNFPTRIAFRVSTRVDSSTIIDSPGAERLIGKGDMLYYSGIDSERVQCALIGLKEISAVTRFIADQTGYKRSYNNPYYLPPVNSADDSAGGGLIDMQNIDAMFEEAAKLVVTTQKGSTSDLQRKLGVGYARAGKIMDQLEAAGIVGPQEGSTPREALIKDPAELEPVIKAFVG